MAVDPSTRFNEGHGRQLAVLYVLIQLVGARDVCRTHRMIGHDLRLVVKSVANVAVLVALRANLSIVELILIGKVAIPLIVVALPGDVVFQQNVANATLRGWRNRERCVAGVCIRVGVAPITEITRVVVVEKIVVALLVDLQSVVKLARHRGGLAYQLARETARNEESYSRTSTRWDASDFTTSSTLATGGRLRYEGIERRSNQRGGNTHEW
jgi:hypothetical protein